MKKPEKLFQTPIQPKHISFDDQGLSKAVNRESLIISLDLIINSLSIKNNSLIVGVTNKNPELTNPEIITYSGSIIPQLNVNDTIKAYFFKGKLGEYQAGNDSDLGKIDAEKLETSICNYGGGIGPGNVIFSKTKYHLFIPRELEQEEKALKIELKNNWSYIDTKLITEYHLEKTTLNQ